MTIDWSRLVDWIIAGGAVALITAISLAVKQWNDARLAREKQSTDKQSTIATAADTISTAAANVVQMQDIEAKEMQAEIRALQSEVVALRTVIEQEKTARVRAEITQQMMERQMNELREAMAVVKTMLYNAQDERAKLARENSGLKGALYDMALGVNQLTAQLKVMNIEPAYTLGVPFDTPDPKPKQTGPLTTRDLRTAQG